MNAIVGFTHLLGQTALDERQADWVKKVGIAARHLLELLHDLLDHATLTAGKLDLEQAPLVFSDLVEPLVDLFTDRAREKGIELVSTIAPELQCSLLGDGRRLKQVLLNLISNAVKFTEHGRVEVIATVADLSAARRGRQRLMEISGVVPSIQAYPAGCRFNPRCALVRAECREQEPPLVDAGQGTRAACWATRPRRRCCGT
jgi:oligopeptide/dipeptide ABC transporter ATP-binding protein